MRRSTKTLGILAVCLIGFGVVLAMLGLVFGAKTSIIYTNGNWQLSDDGFNLSFAGFNLGNRVQISQYERVDTGFVRLDQFEKLDLSLRAVELKIVEGNGYGIALDYRSPEPIKYSVHNGKLTMTQKDYSLLKVANTNQNEGSVIIYVPKDTVLKDVKVTCGMGDFEIADRIIDKMSINVGMGAVELKGITINDLTIEGGMGSIEAKDLTSFNTVVKVGMGSVDLEGDLDGDVRVDGGMGSVNLTTKKSLNSYNYVIDKGLGVISINNEEYNILENVRKDYGASRTIKINGGLGMIEINTAD